MALVLLLSRADLAARVGDDVLRRVYDDNNDGVVDDTESTEDGALNPLTELIKDASSFVLEAYYQTFEAVPEVGAIPHTLKRLAKDVAQAYIGMRHPEYVRYDGYKMFEWCEKQLDKLVEGKRRTGEKPPDPAANQGGDILSSDVDNPCPTKPVFLNGFGAFG